MTFSGSKFRTLGKLRDDVQARIGAVATTAFGDNLIESFLIDAQNQLYELCEWKHLRASAEKEIVAGHVWYDLPDDCNLEKITGIWIKRQGRYVPMHEGISVSDRNWQIGDPCRYDIQWNSAAPDGEWKVQAEIFPPPTYDTTLRIEYTRSLLPFSEPDHEASIPDSAIFLHALTNAKLHFRQPDGPAYQTQLNAMVGKLKSEHRRQKVFGPARVVTDPMAAAYIYPPR